jgi:hypothetical protein
MIAPGVAHDIVTTAFFRNVPLAGEMRGAATVGKGEPKFACNDRLADTVKEYVGDVLTVTPFSVHRLKPVPASGVAVNVATAPHSYVPLPLTVPPVAADTVTAYVDALKFATRSRPLTELN